MTKSRRFQLAISICLLSIGVASCGERAPTAVQAPSQNLERDLLQPVWGLLSCTPLPADSVTQVIGPAGGTINVGPHTFTVPAGALDSAVAITAVAPSDVVNRVVFQPSGLWFQQAAMTMSYANCGVLGSWLPKQIAYVDDLRTSAISCGRSTTSSLRPSPRGPALLRIRRRMVGQR
jgi:hypothetical protein